MADKSRLCEDIKYDNERYVWASTGACLGHHLGMSGASSGALSGASSGACLGQSKISALLHASLMPFLRGRCAEKEKRPKVSFFLFRCRNKFYIFISAHCQHQREFTGGRSFKKIMRKLEYDVRLDTDRHQIIISAGAPLPSHPSEENG